MADHSSLRVAYGIETVTLPADLDLPAAERARMDWLATPRVPMERLPPLADEGARALLHAEAVARRDELRRRYVEYLWPLSKEGLPRLLRMALNAPRDRRDAALDWVTGELVAQHWAGHLSGERLRGIVTRLLEATGQRTDPGSVDDQLDYGAYRADREAEKRCDPLYRPDTLDELFLADGRTPA